MLKKISIFLTRISSTSTVILYLIIALLFILFVLPGFKALIDNMPSGIGLPDQLFYYDAEKLKQFAQIYGDQGRRAYIQCALTYDFAWPILYISFLCIGISYLNNLCLKPNSRLHFLNLIPLIPAFFDALENLSLSILMLTFPDTMDILLNMAGIFTAAKWVSVGLSFSVLGFSILHAIRYRFYKVP